LNPDRYGKRAGNWSKWWSRWRHGLGVKGREKCFHAFRHTFKSTSRESNIHEDRHDALTGHSGGGEGRKYGGFPLSVLDEAMKQYEHPDFKLDWVWKPSADHWDRPVLKRRIQNQPATQKRTGTRRPAK
jgi:hypothetical protein